MKTSTAPRADFPTDEATRLSIDSRIFTYIRGEKLPDSSYLSLPSDALSKLRLSSVAQQPLPLCNVCLRQERENKFH